MRESLSTSIFPFENGLAVSQIDKFLHESELEYHFEEYKSEFNFFIEEDNDLLKITQIITCSLVISPHCNTPILHQYIENHEQVGYLRINDEDIDFKKHAKPDPMNPRRFELRYDLQPHLTTDSNSRILKYERKAIYIRRLSKEPYYCMELMHFAKGFTLEATIGEEYYVALEEFSCLDKKPKATEEVQCTTRKKIWRVGEYSQLLLPGYSYMLIVFKKPKTLSEK